MDQSRRIDRSIDWLIDRSIDWHIDCWFDWLIDCLTDGLIDWWIDWSLDWLLDWFADVYLSDWGDSDRGGRIRSDHSSQTIPAPPPRSLRCIDRSIDHLSAVNLSPRPGRIGNRIGTVRCRVRPWFSGAISLTFLSALQISGKFVKDFGNIFLWIIFGQDARSTFLRIMSLRGGQGG